MLLPSVALAQAPISLHASYDTYAAGMHVAQVEAGLSFGPSTYQMNLGFQTIGMAGFFFGGRQFDFVNGSWHGMQAKPSRFVEKGSWRGIERQAQIEYQDSKPIIRQLVPPNDVEREPVPAGLQANTVDTLSALAELIRVVDATGRCETSVRTYDGRRVLEIDAHTAGEEVLQPRAARVSLERRCAAISWDGCVLAFSLVTISDVRANRCVDPLGWRPSVAARGFRYVWNSKQNGLAKPRCT